MYTKVRPLTVLEKVAYGSGDMAINISMIAASMLIYIFHVQVVGITPIDAGWILLVTRVVDAFSDPIMGTITGKVKTKYGRFRHWIGLGSIPFGISIYLMFSTPQSTYEINLLWAYATYIGNTLIFTMLTIPYISLVGAITNDPKERLKANTYRFTMAKVATLLVTTFVPYWVNSNPDALESYRFAFSILATISSACLIFCCVNVKEQVVIEDNAPKFSIQFKSILKNDQCLILSSAVVLLLIGFLVRGTIAYIYGTEFAGATEGWAIAVFMGMWSVGGFLAAFVSEWLTKRFCKIKVFEYSMYVAAVAGVISYFMVGKGDFALAVFFYFLTCFLSDINTPILWASITEAADYGRKKTGVNAAGLTMGAISFSQKLGMGIAGPIAGYTLDFIGYQADTQLSDATLNGLSVTISFVPAFFFILTGLVIRHYFINNDYYYVMMRSKTLPTKDDLASQSKELLQE